MAVGSIDNLAYYPEVWSSLGFNKPPPESYYPEVWQSLGFKRSLAYYPDVWRSMGFNTEGYYPQVWESLGFKVSLVEPKSPVGAGKLLVTKSSPGTIEEKKTKKEPEAFTAPSSKELAYYPEVWDSLGFKQPLAYYPAVWRSLGFNVEAFYPQVWRSLGFKVVIQSPVGAGKRLVKKRFRQTQEVAKPPPKIKELAYYPEVWRSLGFKKPLAYYPSVWRSLGFNVYAFYPEVWSSLGFKGTLVVAQSPVGAGAQVKEAGRASADDRHWTRQPLLPVMPKNIIDVDSIMARNKTVQGHKKHGVKHLEQNALGNQAFAAKKYDKAIFLYSKAIRLDSNVATFFANRSAVYGIKGDWEASKEDALEVIRLEPKGVKGYVRLAAAQIELEGLEAATEAIKRGLALDDTNRQLLKSKKALKELKKEKAKGKAKEALEYIKNNPKVRKGYVDLANNQIEMGDLKGAAITIEQGLKLDKANPQLLKQMQTVKYLRKKQIAASQYKR